MCLLELPTFVRKTQKKTSGSFFWQVLYWKLYYTNFFLWNDFCINTIKFKFYNALYWLKKKFKLIRNEKTQKRLCLSPILHLGRYWTMFFDDIEQFLAFSSKTLKREISTWFYIFFLHNRMKSSTKNQKNKTRQ